MSQFEQKREKALLIMIDYVGLAQSVDGDVFRGMAVAVEAPAGFQYMDRHSAPVYVDRVISRTRIRQGMPESDFQDREFQYMESQLLRASREAAPHGPKLTLIPVESYRKLIATVERLGIELADQKEENLQLAAQNMKVRNHALRWKALAKKLRQALTSVKRVL